MSEGKKNIEIVNGDGSNLDISLVYDHLNPGEPKWSDEKPKKIVVPEVHKNKQKDKHSDEKSDKK